MKVVVHQDVCIGCGLCESLCPEVFRMNDDNVAEVHHQPETVTDNVQEEVDSCPVSAIEIVED